MGNKKATIIGFSAILLWAMLATLTESTGNIPPFQLVCMSLLIGTIIGLITRKSSISEITQSLSTYILALGIFGLFGYHFFYFSALRNAPAVEAGLIAYLWPILIILMSAFLPGEKLRWFHLAGGVMGLIGAWLIVSKGGQITFQEQHSFGYFMAALCAVTWSSYSVLSRKAAHISTDVITIFCLIGAVLSGICHALLEETVIPSGTTQWASVLLLGLGPVGGAFYVWDYGVKKGNIQILGALSYLAPLLSTILLILFGYATFTYTILTSSLLIAGGAALASKDLLWGE